MKSLAGITPINYIKITNVSGSFTGASAYHYTGYQYPITFSGSTMTYTINEGVVTVTFHMSGCSVTGAEFYTPTLNFSVSIAGYIL